MDPNIWNVRMTMRVPSYYEVHRMFYFNVYSTNNDEEMRYLWTISPHLAKEGTHILVELEHIQQQNIPNTQIVFDESFMLYSTVNNNDDEVDRSDGNDVVSKEGEFQTLLNLVNLVNPVTENIVQQWESSQWFNSARYDYTHSGAFLDMGSGSPIDDIVEFGTVQLLDWNDFMTDIQLGKIR
ncbi:hypothetical protein M9H77_02383 [Catharanthus roseus]|uniref:Uncharacterized protein n=1 Tax=Catharanthus roseus TaxID=4058 RepID=A0ACC0C8A7_CATRO|nr:hypothetical protein M9H77_02383 [Catharanthus roseus]